MSAMLDLAQQEIFARYKQPEYSGKLHNPDLVGEGVNQVCGDEVHLEVLLDSAGRITEMRHTCRACAICTASADMLPQLVLGKIPSELAAIGTQEVSTLLQIPLSPIRLKCALLPLQTLQLAQKPN